MISDNYFCPDDDNYFCRSRQRADGRVTAENLTAPSLGAGAGADGHRQAGPRAEEQADGRQDLGGSGRGRRHERESGAQVADRAAAVCNDDTTNLANAI